MATNGQVTVGLLETAASRDADLVEHRTGLVNDVYATAESGLWREGATRTTAAEVAELIRAEEIAVASRNGQIVGSVRIHEISEDASEFGLLVAAPEERGTGVGRALLDYAEQYSRLLGLRTIRLELLVPREWSHPSKEFLAAWYRRSGYGVIRTDRIDHNHPHLAPLLATPCDLVIYEKPLR
jgi:GNAT superfamily N-acetyltransferase